MVVLHETDGWWWWFSVKLMDGGGGGGFKARYNGRGTRTIAGWSNRCEYEYMYYF